MVRRLLKKAAPFGTAFYITLLNFNFLFRRRACYRNGIPKSGNS